MRTYAVTSGKGGVGKTNLSANIGMALAEKGQRVVIFDADIGLANLDVILGCRAQFTLQHVFSGEKSLRDVIQEGPGGVRFVAGGSGIEALVKLHGPVGDAFLAELNDLDRNTDILIFDTGAGIDDNVMTLMTAADEILLVTTPDPASMTDSYSTAKAILQRKPEATVRVLMNMVDDASQGRTTCAKLTSISQQFLGIPLKYAGYVRMDPRASALIRQRRPFYLANPSLPASQDVARVAAGLMGEVIHLRQVSFADQLRSLFGGLLKAS